MTLLHIRPQPDGTPAPHSSPWPTPTLSGPQGQRERVPKGGEPGSLHPAWRLLSGDSEPGLARPSLPLPPRLQTLLTRSVLAMRPPAHRSDIRSPSVRGPSPKGLHRAKARIHAPQTPASLPVPIGVNGTVFIPPHSPCQNINSLRLGTLCVSLLSQGTAPSPLLLSPSSCDAPGGMGIGSHLRNGGRCPKCRPAEPPKLPGLWKNQGQLDRVYRVEEEKSRSPEPPTSCCEGGSWWVSHRAVEPGVGESTHRDPDPPCPPSNPAVPPALGSLPPGGLNGLPLHYPAWERRGGWRAGGRGGLLGPSRPRSVGCQGCLVTALGRWEGQAPEGEARWGEDAP